MEAERKKEAEKCSSEITVKKKKGAMEWFQGR